MADQHNENGDAVQPLRIGFAGMTNRGGLAYRLHGSTPGVHVAAIMDSDEAVLALARESYGQDLRTTTRFDELLECDLDGIILGTRDGEHEDQIIRALGKGIAVLTNPPFALTIEGCDRVLTAAARAQKPLLTVNALRNEAYLAEMKRLVDEGAVGAVKAVQCRHYLANGGDLYFRDWQSEQAQVNSLLLHAGFQDLDMLQRLAGAVPESLHAFGARCVYGGGDGAPTQGNERADVEDLSMVSMRMANGVLCTYQQCHFAPDTWRSYTILGDCGRIENFGNAPGFTNLVLWQKRHDYHNPEGDARIEIPALDGLPGAPDEQAPLWTVAEAFVDTIRKDEDVWDQTLDAWQASVAACLATESMRAGGGSRVMPPLPPEILRVRPDADDRHTLPAT